MIRIRKVERLARFSFSVRMTSNALVESLGHSDAAHPIPLDLRHRLQDAIAALHDARAWADSVIDAIAKEDR